MPSTNNFHPTNNARIRYWLGENDYDDYHHILHKENPTDSQKDRLNKYLKKIKAHQDYKKIDHIDALVDWIKDHEQQIYLTITLKKSFIQPNGSTKNLEFEDAEKVSVYLKNKITKALLGRRKNLNFFPFLQLNKDDRYHLHITFSNPKNYSIDELKKILEPILKGHKSIYNQRNIQEVYNLKNGKLIEYNSSDEVKTPSFIAKAATFSHNMDSSHQNL